MPVLEKINCLIELVQRVMRLRSMVSHSRAHNLIRHSYPAVHAVSFDNASEGAMLGFPRSTFPPYTPGHDSASWANVDSVMTSLGELARFSAIRRPDLALVTSAARASARTVLLWRDLDLPRLSARSRTNPHLPAGAARLVRMGQQGLPSSFQWNAGQLLIPRLIDLAGVAVFASSGTLAGGKKGLDVFGLFVLAAVTAIGGGTLRDLLLNRPPFWIADSTYLIVIAAAMLATLILGPSMKNLSSALLIADAFGLAFFSISGAQIASASHVGVLPTVVLGTMTGVAGGVLRDVLTAEIPLILRKEIYATAAIAGCAIFVALLRLGIGPTVATTIGVVTIFFLRLAAIRFDLHLPHNPGSGRNLP